MAEGAATTVAALQQPNQSTDWWFIELWWESREIFKELVRHILFFGMLIGSLILFHYVLERSGLPPDQKAALDKVHFWGSVISLVIFTVSFIIKLAFFEFRGKQHE
jgi:hypothetical protein